MKNITQLNNELSAIFEKLKAGEIDAKHADAVSNLTGKLLKGRLGQLAYYEQRKETPSIPFWQEPEAGE